MATSSGAAYHSPMVSYRYLMAIDPSLTCSGWALLSVPDGGVIAVGKIKSDPPSIPLATRLEKLQDRISSVLANLTLGPSDVLVCEAPTTMKDPHNAIKVEQVRGLFESAGRSRGVSVPGRVNPRSVQYEVMGLKGKQLVRAEVKASAVRTVQYLYAAELRRLGIDSGETALSKHQDIVDAILIGRFALLKVKGAVDTRQSLESVFGPPVKQMRNSWRVRSCTM
jgi:Holliday junction resolvasome RuvABC endonuclease subunit